MNFKNALIIITVLSFTTNLFANICGNFAQEKASFAHKKDIGPIKGMSNFKTNAELITNNESNYEYLIRVRDNNPGQPVWEVNYIVNTRYNGKSCELISLRKGLIKPPKRAGVFRAYVDRTFCGELSPFILGDLCIVYMTKADQTKLAVVFNRPSTNEIFRCNNVVVNSFAISPIKNQAVMNELRAYDPNYYYMYGTYFDEIFKEIRY